MEYIESMRNSEKSTVEEIANITYHYNGVSWDEAWSLSYTERTIVVDNLKKIIEKQNKANKKGR